MQVTSSSSAKASGASAERRDRLSQLIEHAAHLLPAQGPITAFVHHNTLHAFEELAFEEAVVKGAEIFGCHAYFPEGRYRAKLARGRIRREDIEAVLIEDLDEHGDQLLGFLGTKFHLRMAMMEHPLRIGSLPELRWVIEETDALRRFCAETPAAIRDRVVSDTSHWVMRDLRNGRLASPKNADNRIQTLVANLFELFDDPDLERWSNETWESFTLHLLWLVSRQGVAQVPADERPRQFVRHRDWLLEATGDDTDQIVHEVLIRFCGAFLDQGLGDWSLPERGSGLYGSFSAVYQRSFGPPEIWMRRMAADLKRLRQTQTDALDSIAESLTLLGVGRDEEEQFITQTLLALRGYAGMIWQMETRGDRVALPVPKGTLIDYLAVRLLLERHVLASRTEETPGLRGPLNELRVRAKSLIRARKKATTDQRAFLVFQLAQTLGWAPESLYRMTGAEWTQLVGEIEAFNTLDRRRIYHLAFERRYRLQTLDAIAVHNRRVRAGEAGRQANLQSDKSPVGGQVPTDSNGVHPAEKYAERRPSFQMICCIDDREESFRRHLEEVAPECETFGTAGFFAVAMYYRGAADAHFTPLCPVIIKPQHYVTEEAVYTLEGADRRRRMHRRTIGNLTRQVHVGSRTFAGGALAAVLGSLASIPLVMRILFPRATAQLRALFGNLVNPPSATHLQLERSEKEPGSTSGHIGYSMPEMANLVERMLRDIGLTKNLSRLVVICGHGSSSLNNPHESAYNCGACAGARGGPNARAAAQMANDPRVRQVIEKRGLHLPADTVFVGAYHNTCDDSVLYFDLDRLPSSHKSDFTEARLMIDEARLRNAHERCRRFESAELTMSPEAALRHVEGRAEDLSQARPEYNHATNALCLVGRRQWSRGLFLDRRAFLQSYDPAQDDEQATLLTRILQAVIPVCAGINLEYYFCCVDPVGWGAGNKLPHNIASLLGVMDGAASDLRPGLYRQMTEIHEPVRLLFIIETNPETMLRIMENNPGIDRLIRGNWVQVALLDSANSKIHVFRKGAFQLHKQRSEDLPEVASSFDWYRGWRDHLGFASINEGNEAATASLFPQAQTVHSAEASKTS